VIAGSGTAMERDYDFASAVYGGDLRQPEEIGRQAAQRAIKRLGARKMPTGKVPVIFDRASRAASSRICWGRSRGHRSRAAPAFSRTSSASASSPKGSALSKTRTSSAGSARSHSTAEGIGQPSAAR